MIYNHITLKLDILDSFDIQILHRLLDNCRESDRHIGMRIGMTGGSVRGRIDKMIRAGIIESFSMRIEPQALGRGVFYVVASGRDHREMLRKVSLVGDPFVVVPCVGGITVCGIVARTSVSDAIGLAKELMGGMQVLSIFRAQEGITGPSLTRTDLKVISELVDDPQKMIEEIAAGAGLSTKTVARSLEKIRKNSAVRFTLEIDPTKMDGYIPHAVMASVSEDEGVMLERLEEKFGVHYIQRPFVAKNQITMIMYSDNIFKLDDLTQQVREMPGVESASLFIPKKMVVPGQWVRGAIEQSMNSATLHIAS